MARAISNEKSFADDEDDRAVGLVNYSSSSEDEDDRPAPPPPLKKIRLNDSESRLDTSMNSHVSNVASEDEKGMSTTGNKQGLSDSGSDTSLHNHALEDENVMCGTHGNKPSFTDSGLKAPLGGSNFVPEELHFSTDSDDEEEEEICETDWDLLKLRPVNRRAPKWNRPEVYAVYVDREEPRDKSRCLKLLNVIGCENRFRGLSVETGRTFFADLNKDEAARLRDVKGVRIVHQYRLCFGNIM